MDTKIFIKAARKVDSGEHEFSCCAIIVKSDYKEGNKDLQHAREIYTQLYDIRGTESFSSVHYRLMEEDISDVKLKEIRVLALLFAAQVFKNKGKL